MYGLLLYNFFLRKAPCHPYQKQKPKNKHILKWSIYGGKRSAEGAAAEVSLSLQIFCISNRLQM